MTLKARARAFAGRARRSAHRRLTPPAPTFATAPPRPVPTGWSEAELRRVMESFTIDDAPPEALAGYVDEAFWRFLHTWGCVRDAKGTSLELGANPYFLTYLLHEFTDLDLTLANFFGSERGTLVQDVGWRDRDATERSEKMRCDMKFAGFTIDHQFTADSRAPVPPYEERAGYAALAPALAFRQNDLGQYLFAVARPTHQPRTGLPDFLYRSYPPDQIVPAI